MANLDSKIVITQELRPCKFIYNKQCTNVLFHMFDTEGSAVIELENGNIAIVDSRYITFLDNKFKEYNFGDK